jgi:hypothetical protein
MKEQIEKGYESSVNFYSDYVERQAVFTGKIIDAGIDNVKKMSECKSIDQAIETQVAHYKNIWEEYQTNGKVNAQAFDKMQAELGQLYKVAEPVVETKQAVTEPAVKAAVAKAPVEKKPAAVKAEPVAKVAPVAVKVKPEVAVKKAPEKKAEPLKKAAPGKK